MNRNQAFGMNNSLSSNIFNGTGKPILNLHSLGFHLVAYFVCILCSFPSICIDVHGLQ